MTQKGAVISKTYEKESRGQHKAQVAVVAVKAVESRIKGVAGNQHIRFSLRRKKRRSASRSTNSWKNHLHGDI